MNKYLPRRGTLCTGLFGGALLLIVIALAVPSSSKPRAVTVRIDSKGVAHLGPIPLGNDTLRKLTFTVVRRAFPDRRFEVVTSTGAPFTNVVAVMGSLLSAGVDLCTVATRPEVRFRRARRQHNECRWRFGDCFLVGQPGQRKR